MGASKECLSYYQILLKRDKKSEFNVKFIIDDVNNMKN